MKNQIENQKDDRFEQTNKIILNNDKFLVAIDGSSYDSVAAGSGLGILLNSLGKEVVLYSSNPVNPSDFTGLEKTQNFVQQLTSNGNKMEIVFNCPLDNIERVDSGREGDKLSLVVNFKSGVGEISPADVEIKRPDPVFPAGFIIGAEMEKEDYLTSQGEWVWLSRQKAHKNWAKVNVVEEKATLSESLIALVSRGDFQIPVEAANNFYYGIKEGTNNFESADSIALETAAYCLRIKEKKEKKPEISEPSAKDSEEKSASREVEAKESTSPESKEGKKEGKKVSEWKKPPIFTGATTPKK